MNILHISDIHFRREYETSEGGYKGMLAKMQSPLIPLEKYLHQLQERTTLDLVIISGDLTEDGEVEDYRYLKNWLQEALGETEMIVTLGNHDIKENFWVGWFGEKASEKPYNQVVMYPEYKEQPIILVTHHHLLSQQNNMPKWPGTERFLALIEPYDIRCILNGHTHHVFMDEINGIPYFTVASMSFVGENVGDGLVRFEERYGYNLYCVEQGRITHQTTENFISGHVLKTLDMR